MIEDYRSKIIEVKFTRNQLLRMLKGEIFEGYKTKVGMVTKND